MMHNTYIAVFAPWRAHLQGCRHHNVCILILEYQVGHLFTAQQGRGNDVGDGGGGGEKES